VLASIGAPRWCYDVGGSHLKNARASDQGHREKREHGGSKEKTRNGDWEPNKIYVVELI